MEKERIGPFPRLVDGSDQLAATERLLPEYDGSKHVGLRITVFGGAIERADENGEETIELLKPGELRAAASMLRCLTPERLRGAEMKAMRKILGLTLADLAKRMGERTAPETISRWESESQPMGGYAEKTLRLLICEELWEKAPGIDYQAKMIVDLNVTDPWRADPSFELPPISLQLLPTRLKQTVIETWNQKKVAIG